MERYPLSGLAFFKLYWIPPESTLRLQQEDGPEPINEDGSPFCFRAVAPVVLFGRNAPPPSKSVMQIQPSTAKLTPKRKRLSEAAAPRVCAKTRKTLVRKVRKETAPSSPNPPPPVADQVWPLFPLRNRVLFIPLLVTLSFPAACCCRSLQRGGAPMSERFVCGDAGGRGRTHQGPDHPLQSWCDRLGRPFCIGCCLNCSAGSAGH
jgi:hypothetical protein